MKSSASCDKGRDFAGNSTVEKLRKNASFLSLAYVAAILKEVKPATYDASRLGEELKARDFPSFLFAKPAPKSPIALPKYKLPREMEKLYP